LPSTAFEVAHPPPSSSARPPSSEERFTTRSIGAHASTDGSPNFHGAPVDLDLKGADVHDVFRLLADVGKVNIVVDGSVTGTVTMRLRHVPWDQAMDVIARARGLSYEREGSLIFVRPASLGPADVSVERK
jgi:type II secretory pathway component HofQ